MRKNSKGSYDLDQKQEERKAGEANKVNPNYLYGLIAKYTKKKSVSKTPKPGEKC